MRRFIKIESLKLAQKQKALRARLDWIPFRTFLGIDLKKKL